MDSIDPFGYSAHSNAQLVAVFNLPQELLKKLCRKCKLQVAFAVVFSLQNPNKSHTHAHMTKCLIAVHMSHLSLSAAPNSYYHICETTTFCIYFRLRMIHNELRLRALSFFCSFHLFSRPNKS